MTRPGAYRHWKGDVYVVFGVAHDSNNQNPRGPQVIYKSIRLDRLNLRDEMEFNEEIEPGLRRFTYIPTGHE